MDRHIDLRDEVNRTGYAFMPRFRPDLGIQEIANGLGEIFKASEHSAFSILTPKRMQETTPNTYSGLYGLESFPLHTDLAHWRNPPRYLSLRCEHGCPDVTTELIDGKELLGSVSADLFTRTVCRPRRPINGKIPLLQIVSFFNETNVIRWDETFLIPASKRDETGFDAFRSAVAGISKLSIALVDRGDTLVIDNWRMLHGRSSIPPGCEQRRVARAYLTELK